MNRIKDGVVFSNDINLILNGYNALKYVYKENGILVPDNSFIENIRKDFCLDAKKYYEKNITIVNEEEMSYYMNLFIKELEGIYPIISMDEIYVNCDNNNVYALDCTRFNKIMVTRKNPKDLNGVRKEIERISNRLKLLGKKEIVLLDDVVFKGGVVDYLNNLFKEFGIEIVGVRAAISTQEGYEKFKGFKLGLKCGYLMSNEVDDEICERDFYYGIAQSGETVMVNNQMVKRPYFLPMGNPVGKASVPEKNAKLFSKGCLERSLALFEEMERLSNREIYNKELPEKIDGSEENERVVKTLKKYL